MTSARVRYEAPCHIRAGYPDQCFIQVTPSHFPAFNAQVIGINLTKACEQAAAAGRPRGGSQ